jgi:DNA-binding SARP family transcriptional activator
MNIRFLELPSGYHLEMDPDILTLRRADDSEVAYFSANGATPEMVRLAAEEDMLGVHADERGAEVGNGTAASRRLRVHFLGRFELVYDGAAVPPCRHTKALAILKYLLAYPGQPVSRDFLMGWLWPEANLRKARWSLNSSVHALRRFLGDNLPFEHAPGLVVCDEGHYRLSPTLRPRSDVEEFDERYARGRSLEVERGMPGAVAEYERAAELYRGDYLSEDLYEDWTIIERERLFNAYVYMLDRLCGYYLETGNQQRGIEACYELLEKDPCHEESHRRLIACYAQLGMRERASRQYQVCARVLKSRYGVDPSPDTHATYRSVLAR